MLAICRLPETQALEGFAVCFVFYKTALHQGQSMPAAKLCREWGSRGAVGGEAENGSSGLILEYLPRPT